MTKPDLYHAGQLQYTLRFLDDCVIVTAPHGATPLILSMAQGNNFLHSFKLWYNA